MNTIVKKTSSIIEAFGRTFKMVGCRYYARPVKLPPQPVESAHPFYDPWFDSSPRGPHPRTKTGSKHTITAIPGVGIGREMIDATLEVFACCGAPIIIEWINECTTEDALENMQLSLRRNGVAIKGNIEDRKSKTIIDQNDESKNFLLQEALDLYANLTILKSFKGLEKEMRFHKQIDLIVIRSNTEGEYALLEHEVIPGSYEHLRVITAYNTRRVAEFAFGFARKENRKKVTLLHRSEIMPTSEGLFVSEFLKVAEKNTDIPHEVMNLRRATQTLPRSLHNFDVIVSNSIYCVQLVEFLTGMIGGPRLVSIGSFNDRFAVFEPSVNSRSRALVGKGVANPTPFLLCGAYALEFLGLKDLARTIKEGIEFAFVNGVKTPDLSGNATTDRFIAEVVRYIQANVPRVICKFDKPPKIGPKVPEDWAPKKRGFDAEKDDKK